MSHSNATHTIPVFLAYQRAASKKLRLNQVILPADARYNGICMSVRVITRPVLAPIAHDPCWHSGHNGMRRDIPRHDSTCTDGCTLTDCDPAQNGGI